MLLMTSRRFIKWDSPLQNSLVRKKNTCTGHFSIIQFSLKKLKNFWYFHRKHFSSHIVLSPFPKNDIPKILVPELILDIADQFPEAIALKCGLTGRSYKFAELQLLSQRFTNSLIKAGFLHKDVVAVTMSNCPEFPIVMLGALQADMAVTLINHIYTPDEMCRQLKDSGSVCVVSGVDQLPVVQAAITKLEQTTRSNPIRKIIAMDIPGHTSLPEGVTKFSEAIADHVDHSRTVTNKSTVNDLAFMPYSSGTTGLAKGVYLSHSNIVSCLHQIYFSGIKVSGPDRGQDTTLGLLPFSHIYGLQILLNAVCHGGQIITFPVFRPGSLIHTLESEKPSMLFLAPALVSFLGIDPVIAKNHLVNTKLVVTGADLIEVSTMERLKTKLPPECNFGNGFGLTEMAGVAMIPIFPVKNLATCGVPVALTQAKIVCQNTGKSLGPNQTGELCFQGPQVMVGYHNNPEATAKMIDEEGWLKTGDIGYYDEDNHFYIKGRIKELIKVKGFQVPPAELESVLRTHPSIDDVAVVGVPHPKAGQTPVAFIVRARGPEGQEVPLTEEQVKQFLSEKVAKHKQVSQVFFVNNIPKSHTGKILRQELLDGFQNGEG